MSRSEVHDVVVVGGGVIGLAVARALTLQGKRCLVCESEKQLLDGASGGNSAIVHTGFDASPQSTELQCLINSRQPNMAFQNQHNLPHSRCGALIVAWSQSELEYLPRLLAHARSSGDDVKILSRNDLFKKEPFLNHDALGALWVPNEMVVDSWLTAMAMMQEAVHCGAKVYRDSPIQKTSQMAGAWCLSTPRGDIIAKSVVNCAGLYGDDLDKLAGFHPAYEIRPRKGQFVVFSKTAKPLVNSIIYPVPTPKTKGQLVFPTVYGNVVVGPTAEDQISRTQCDLVPGTLNKLVARAHYIVPELSRHAVVGSYAGLRPATQHQDYVIKLRKENLHHQSPIVQGGLEIPICMSVSLENTKKGRLAIAKYDSLWAEPYSKPADRSFDNATRAVLNELQKEVTLSNWLTVAGIRSTGLSAALGLSDHVTSLLGTQTQTQSSTAAFLTAEEASGQKTHDNPTSSPQRVCCTSSHFSANTLLEDGPDGRLALHFAKEWFTVTHPLTHIGHGQHLSSRFVPSGL